MDKQNLAAELRRLERPISDDVTLAEEILANDLPRDGVMGCQACFVKDLDLYLAGLPQRENSDQN